MLLFQCVSCSDQTVFVFISEDFTEPTPKSFKILLLRDAASDEDLIQACQVSHYWNINWNLITKFRFQYFLS